MTKELLEKLLEGMGEKYLAGDWTADDVADRVLCLAEKLFVASMGGSTLGWATCDFASCIKLAEKALEFAADYRKECLALVKE